jgi:hypothetical protein
MNMGKNDPAQSGIYPSAGERPAWRWGRRRFSAGRFGGKCYACGEELQFVAFAPDRTKASGRKSICTRCDREKARAYYLRTKGDEAQKSVTG